MMNSATYSYLVISWSNALFITTTAPCFLSAIFYFYPSDYLGMDLLLIFLYLICNSIRLIFGKKKQCVLSLFVTFVGMRLLFLLQRLLPCLHGCRIHVVWVFVLLLLLLTSLFLLFSYYITFDSFIGVFSLSPFSPAYLSDRSNGKYHVATKNKIWEWSSMLWFYRGQYFLCMHITSHYKHTCKYCCHIVIFILLSIPRTSYGPCDESNPLYHTHPLSITLTHSITLSCIHTCIHLSSSFVLLSLTFSYIGCGWMWWWAPLLCFSYLVNLFLVY